MTALVDLMRLHREGKKLVGKGASIKLERVRAAHVPEKDGKSGFKSALITDTLWVSGLPYLFTSYPERAFVFANQTAARTFIERHKEELKPYQCKVHVWGNWRR